MGIEYRALIKVIMYLFAYVAVQILLGGEVIDAKFHSYLLMIILYENMSERYRGKE